MLSLACKRLQHLALRRTLSFGTRAITGYPGPDDYEVIESAEAGSRWMERIRDRVRSAGHVAERGVECGDYAERVGEVDDAIWFGVDTEFTEKQRNWSHPVFFLTLSLCRSMLTVF